MFRIYINVIRHVDDYPILVKIIDVINVSSIFFYQISSFSFFQRNQHILKRNIFLWHDKPKRERKLNTRILKIHTLKNSALHIIWQYYYSAFYNIPSPWCWKPLKTSLKYLCQVTAHKRYNSEVQSKAKF